MITSQKHALEGYLTGQFLTAMPQMKDSRFLQSVIYICGHDENGAMGFIINRIIDSVHLSDLLKQLDIPSSLESKSVPVFFGGPIEMGRGFVIHSADYMYEGSLTLSEEISLTATLDILKTIAESTGPKEFMCVLGYTGWSSGQLETELQQNVWLPVPVDYQILFHAPIEKRWHLAFEKIGFTPEDLSFDVGHA